MSFNQEMKTNVTVCAISVAKGVVYIIHEDILQEYATKNDTKVNTESSSE